MKAAIETTKAVVLAVTEAVSPTKRSDGTAVAKSMSVRTTVSGLSLRGPIFNWKSQDKYNELLNFKLEVKTYF